MLLIAGRAITIVALCFVIGLHWVALQSVAWTTMMIQNAKSTSICRAVERTFDGAHPCSLCHVVSKGKASEKKSNAQTSPSKIDMIAVGRVAQVLPRVVPFQYQRMRCSLFTFANSPLAPPPRSDLRSRA